MAGKNSLLDNEFDDEDDLLRSPSFGKDEEDDDQGKAVDVQIEDDTPEADRGKPTSDDRPADDDLTEEDEATAYTKRVKNRLGKEAARYHNERRTREDRERQLNEAVQVAQRLINENNQLKGFIENGEKVFMTEHQQRLDADIKQAQHAYREAIEAGDVTGQVAAQTNLARLSAQADRISIHRPQPLGRTDPNSVVQQFAQPVQQAQPEPEALRWQEKNKWFGRDDAMTAYAMGLHKQLEREGVVPSDGKEYWGRLDKDLKQRFPEKYTPITDSGTPRRTNTVVAPATRTAGGKQTRTVTLTETQASLARRLGLTVQQYAEQLVAEGTGNKDYTHGRK